MLKAIVISNAIEGIENMFQSNAKVTYTLFEITKNFNPDFSGYDILIVPNGSDNIAMYRIKDKVKNFLDEGNILFCFDGFFTDWVPGNTWIMNNDLKTIDVRYTIKNDKYHLFEGVDLQKLIFSHGISGWWACGYIETENPENAVLVDTWNRTIIVVDETSTNGILFLTASAPMADMLFGTNDEGQTSWAETGKLYQNLIDAVIGIKENKSISSKEVAI